MLLEPEKWTPGSSLKEGRRGGMNGDLSPPPSALPLLFGRPQDSIPSYDRESHMEASLPLHPSTRLGRKVILFPSMNHSEQDGRMDGSGAMLVQLCLFVPEI